MVKKTPSKSMFFRVIDSRYFYPVGTLVVIGIAGLFFMLGHGAVIRNPFASRPAIVLIDEQLLFRDMQGLIPRSDLLHPSVMRSDGIYLSHLIDSTVHHYHKEGVSVVLAKGVISVPKDQDITNQLLSALTAHLKNAHAKS